MKYWQISQRGILGCLFLLIIGMFHMIYEVSIKTNEYGWTILGFEFNNPVWFMTPWATIGCIFFLWAGWFFPAQARKRRLEFNSAFTQPGDLWIEFLKNESPINSGAFDILENKVFFCPFTIFLYTRTHEYKKPIRIYSWARMENFTRWTYCYFWTRIIPITFWNHRNISNYWIFKGTTSEKISQYWMINSPYWITRRNEHRLFSYWCNWDTENFQINW